MRPRLKSTWVLVDCWLERWWCYWVLSMDIPRCPRTDNHTGHIIGEVLVSSQVSHTTAVRVLCLTGRTTVWTFCQIENVPHNSIRSCKTLNVMSLFNCVQAAHVFLHLTGVLESPFSAKECRMCSLLRDVIDVTLYNSYLSKHHNIIYYSHWVKIKLQISVLLTSAVFKLQHQHLVSSYRSTASIDESGPVSRW